MKWEGRWLDLAGLWADGGEEAMRAPRQVREEHLVLLPGVVAAALEHAQIAEWDPTCLLERREKQMDARNAH